MANFVKVRIFEGLDLSGRKITSSIGSLVFGTTPVVFVRTVAENSVYQNNTIQTYKTNQGVSIASYTFNGEETIFYSYDGSSATVNLAEFTLPEGFGVVSELNTDSPLWERLTRTFNEHIYLYGEDWGRIPIGQNGAGLAILPGEGWTFNEMICAGYVTANRKAIVFQIPTPPLFAESASFFTLHMGLRTVGGKYVTALNTDGTDSITIDYTMPSIIVNGSPISVVTDVSITPSSSGLECRITFGQLTTSSNDLVNNTPMGVTVSGKLVFS